MNPSRSSMAASRWLVALGSRSLRLRSASETCRITVSEVIEQPQRFRHRRFLVCAGTCARRRLPGRMELPQHVSFADSLFIAVPFSGTFYTG